MTEEIKELKWVMCSRKECIGKIGQVSGKGFFSVKKHGSSPANRISITTIGKDFTTLATCNNHFCDKLTSITVENGKLKEEGLILKEVKKDA